MNIFELNIYLDYFVSKNSFIKDPRTLKENYVLACNLNRKDMNRRGKYVHVLGKKCRP